MKICEEFPANWMKKIIPNPIASTIPSLPEDANAKEIRNAEVNVLSMCGSAGTAASVLAIPPRRELELRWAWL
jgi:hypothetical protein